MAKHCQENEEIAENLNNFFSDRITNLKLPPYEDPTTNAENIADPVLKAIEKYKNHPSIRIINDSGFTFNQVSLEEIQKGLKSLNPSKASQSSDGSICPNSTPRNKSIII